MSVIDSLRNIKYRIMDFGPQTRRVLPWVRHQFFLGWKDFSVSLESKEPLFVMSSFRTGSNLLLSYLNNFEDVRFEGQDAEIFRHEDYYEYYTMMHAGATCKEKALRHLRRSIKASPTKIAGIKIMFLHLEDYGISQEELLKAYPQAKLIVNYRKNLAEQYVSTLKATKSGQFVKFNKNNDRSSELTVSIDRDKFTEFCLENKKNFESFLNQKDIAGRCLVVSYEELVENPHEVINERIGTFLDQSPCELKTRFLKQSKHPLNQMIENYNDVKDLIESDLAYHDYSSYQSKFSGVNS